MHGHIEPYKLMTLKDSIHCHNVRIRNRVLGSKRDVGCLGLLAQRVQDNGRSLSKETVLYLPSPQGIHEAEAFDRAR
jgi:hypothetical protein